MLTLKELRRREVISTRELADRANVSPATIWRIERGDVTNIRPATMRAIARALNVTPASIDEFVDHLEENRRSRKGEVAVSRNLADLAAQQGVRPIMDPRRLVGDFWPDEERVEEFTRTVYAWRQEGNNHRDLG